MIGTSQPKRLLVLCTTTGYQTCAFIEAAQKLGLSITFGTDRCHVLDDPWQDGALPLRFEDPEASAQRICDFAAYNPLQAISPALEPAPDCCLWGNHLSLRAQTTRALRQPWCDSRRYPRGICAGVRAYSQAFAKPGGRCFA